MLLTVADMPSGWKEQPVTPSSSTTTGCTSPKTLIDKSALAKATNDFAAAAGAPQWQEGLAAVPASSAQSLFSSVSGDLDGCSSINFSGGTGAPTTLSIKPLSFGSVGDQSGAWTLSGTVDGTSISFDVVVARFGSVLSVFLYAAIGSVEPGFQTLVNKAAAKITAATGNS